MVLQRKFQAQIFHHHLTTIHRFLHSKFIIKQRPSAVLSQFNSSFWTPHQHCYRLITSIDLISVNDPTFTFSHLDSMWLKPAWSRFHNRFTGQTNSYIVMDFSIKCDNFRTMQSNDRDNCKFKEPPSSITKCSREYSVGTAPEHPHRTSTWLERSSNFSQQFIEQSLSSSHSFKTRLTVVQPDTTHQAWCQRSDDRSSLHH